MVPPERPLVYRKIPRLYRGCARRATGMTGRSAGRLTSRERAGPVSIWSRRPARFGRIRPKNA